MKKSKGKIHGRQEDLADTQRGPRRIAGLLGKYKGKHLLVHGFHRQPGGELMPIIALLLWPVPPTWVFQATISLLKWTPWWDTFVFLFYHPACFSLPDFNLLYLNILGVILSTETCERKCTYVILPCPPLSTHIWFERSYARINSPLLATTSYQGPSSRVGVACQVPSVGHAWPFTWHAAVLMESYSFYTVICETELAGIVLMNMHLQNWSHWRKSPN